MFFSHKVKLQLTLCEYNTHIIPVNPEEPFAALLCPLQTLGCLEEDDLDAAAVPIAGIAVCDWKRVSV